MNIGFYNAVSGMKAFQEKLDVTSQNIANMNTDGYMEMTAQFRDLLYTNMNSKVESEPQTGHGTKIQSVDYIFDQGLLRPAPGALNYAIVGDGYFAVDDGGNIPVYTRNGNFRAGLGPDGNYYLTTQDGAYVLSRDRRRIQLNTAPGTNNLLTEALESDIGMFSFANPGGLKPVGDTCVVATAASGTGNPIVPDMNHRVVGGYLESSTVDIGSEMVEVIQTQRAFQLNSRVVQTADQLEEMVNNLR